MTSVIRINEQKCYIDGILRRNLDAMYDDIRKDDDVVMIIDGKERAGKSVLAIQIAWYLSRGKLSIPDICLEPESFQERVRIAKPYEVIIFDECYLGMAATDWQNQYNKLIKKMLITVGQKNLVLIMVLPSVFEISRYVAMHRSDALIHVYKYKGKRGYFNFYNNRNLQKLYIYGKKTYSYWKPKPNFHGKFINRYMVEEQGYRDKKMESLNDFLKKYNEESVSTKTVRLYTALQVLKRETGWSNSQICREVGTNMHTMKRACDFKP